MSANTGDRAVDFSLSIGMVLTTALVSSFLIIMDVPAAESLPIADAQAAVSPDQLLAADINTAQVSAREQGFRVEALSERSDSATTWANPDGSFTTEEFAGPVRVADVDEDSGWRDLDYDLEFKPDGTVGPKSGYEQRVLGSFERRCLRLRSHRQWVVGSSSPSDRHWQVCQFRL